MNEHSEVLRLILKSEGGLNEDEGESVGGVSYAGITQRAYDAFLKEDGHKYPDALSDVESVRQLADRHDVIEVFYVWYLGKYHTWELPTFLQYIYADFVTNAGSAAVKIIQRMAGVGDDGVWGSGTSRAVAEWKAKIEAELATDPNVDNDLITEFHEAKLAHYNFLYENNPSKYGKWIKGWKRRANNVLGDLGDYFENDEPTPKAVDDDDPMHLEIENQASSNNPQGLQDISMPAGDLTDLSTCSNAQLIAVQNKVHAEITKRLGVTYRG